jgi:hypothetical protein
LRVVHPVIEPNAQTPRGLVPTINTTLSPNAPRRPDKATGIPARIVVVERGSKRPSAKADGFSGDTLMATVKRPPGLMNCKAAAGLLGITQYRTWMLAAAGHIKAVSAPGYPLSLDRQSVERRAAELRPKPPAHNKRRPAKATSA